MLSQLAGSVGEMGAGRNFGANALRQIVRPDNQAAFRGEKFALDNSANLMQMAQWAERNGFDDKSRQYMALADRYQQREIEETKRQKLSEAQLGVSKLLSQMQAVATDKTLPTADRTARINELSLEAQKIAAAGGMNPVSVVNPTNEFLNYVATADANSSAASILTEANTLKREINLALAQGDTTKAERLMAGLPAIRARANALGDPDLIADVDQGMDTIINKMPDAQERQWESRATRAFEYYLSSGDEDDPRALQITAQPEAGELYRKKIAEHKAAKKAAEKLELQLENQRLENAKLTADLDKAQREGGLIPATQFRALKEAGEYAAYERAWRNMAEAPFKRQQLNADMRKRNTALQEMMDKSLKDQAAGFILQAPTLLEQMETDGIDWTADLDEWVEDYGRAILAEPETAKMLAGVIAGDPNFIGAETEEERQRIALEKIIRHLYSYDENFKEAWDANEANRKREDSNKDIIEAENEAEWVTVTDGPFEYNTWPDHSNGYYKRKFNETNEALKRAGQEPESESSFRERWTRDYKLEVARVPLRKEKGFPALKPLEERYNNYLDSRSGSVAPRPPAGPSVLDRQRAKLSPPMGPMGDPEDYETKLKRARQAQPNSPYAGSFLTDFPETTPPYIDPRYRNFGG